ncbi:28S ribosomal protein S22, mitochondrial [Habropoda laboriosa]|uniref:28S ribosomal protein S22, mitochondrial n=1 Tax=Habropoda laboriosa TaxID=597456 RepID=A0A0L7RA58_9HYME|nr:PREDICTED: 28S ribosomal protein S22, mitochondrial [Habropoda laboriosa]KOC67745.1 28S ribosomal protein S22, mitochondrial [Habropoda laboriosa]
MMSSRINLIIRNFYKRPGQYCRLCSTVSRSTNEKDPASLFFNENVQEYLTTLTRINYEKVFSARRDGTPLDVPKYKFMTDKELQEARAKISTKAKGRIQMPPVVKIRAEPEILSKDVALQGLYMHNIVFTDISFGSNNRNRLIVVREPNGTLRHANSNERHRMNQVYFPISNREVHIPEMFKNPYLNNLLEREEFEFILDRACIQFEPDDPEYHRITKEVYSYVNKVGKFQSLRSTRHFGPMAFHLAWEDNIHTLLIDVIKSGNIEEAGALIRLYNKIHPEAKSGKEPIFDDAELVKLYATLDSSKQYAIMSALNTYETIQNEREEMKESILKAHGLTNSIDERSET